MKKFGFFVLAATLLLVVVALANSSDSACCGKDRAMSCCVKSDSCPMKSKDHAKAEGSSCCSDCECCKKGSCPMKKKDAPVPPAANDQKTGEHAEHNCGCCGMKKPAETVATSDLSLR